MMKRCSNSSLLTVLATVVASWSWLAIVRIEAFSPRASISSATSYYSNNNWSANNIRSATRISQFNHGRPLFATSDNATATADITYTDGTGTTKNKQSNKQRKINRQGNYNAKQRTKYQKKPKSSSSSSKSNSPNSNRPYTDLSVDELKQLTEHHLSQNIQPNGSISIGTMSPAQMHEFSRLLSSWSKLSSPHHQKQILAAEMAEQCLRELIEEQIAGNAHAQKMITMDMYYLVIKAWLKVGGYKDFVHATSLLDLMELHTSKTQSSSLKCYAAVLNGWCKSRSMGAEVKAEEILNRMKSRDVRHYNNVMNRIANNNKPNAGPEAERLLEELISSYKFGGENSTIAPNRNSFNTVIKAYANAKGGRNGAQNAQRILGMMEDPTTTLGVSPEQAIAMQALPDETNLLLQILPDKISYTSILMAWANTNSHSNNGEQSNAGEKAEELLKHMVKMYRSGTNGGIKPDTVTYNAVLKVWGKCGHPNAGERSEALLDKMLQLYEKGGDSDVIPDDVTFNSVIHNIANSNAADSPQRAMRLLERMEKSYESGLIRAKPDIISYNSVLNAFAKNGGPESAQHAEEMLDNLEKRSYARSMSWNTIRPDVYSYNIVISAWGNCGYANKAVALLDRMTALTNEGKADLKPDVTTYNTVLHAWSQSSDRNAPVKALGLLEIMLRLHEGGDNSANPDVLSFSTVINAFSKSKFPRKARQTRDLLRRMKHLYENGQKRMQPNVYVYAAVLNACAYTFGRTEEKEEALKVGIETFEELQSSSGIETNHVAYGSFIRVCRRLMADDSRTNHFITRAFGQCCEDGQLGEYVLRQLRAVPKLYVTLLQEYIVDDEVSYQDLPSSWTCNVKDRKRWKSDEQFGKRKNVWS